MSGKGSSKADLMAAMFGDSRAPKPQRPPEEKPNPLLVNLQRMLQRAREKDGDGCIKACKEVAKYCAEQKSDVIKALRPTELEHFTLFHAHSYSLQAIHLANKGSLKDAEKAYTRAIAIRPAYLYFTERGVVYERLAILQKENVDKQAEYWLKAKDDFTKAITMRPACIYAHLLLGNISFSASHDLGSSIELASKLQIEGDIISENSDFSIEVSRQAKILSQCVHSLFRVTAASLEYGQHERVLQTSALLLNLLEQPATVQKYVVTYLEKKGISSPIARVFHLRGLAFLKPEMVANVGNDLRVVGGDAYTPEALQAAVAVFTKAIAAADSQETFLSSIYYQRSFAYVRLGAYALALEDMEKAVALKSNNSWLQLEYIEVLIYNGKLFPAYTEALKLKKQILESHQPSSQSDHRQIIEKKLNKLISSFDQKDIGYPLIKEIMHQIVNNAWGKVQERHKQKQVLLDHYPQLKETKEEYTALDLTPVMTPGNIIWLDEVQKQLEGSRALGLYGSVVTEMVYYKKHLQSLKAPNNINLFAYAGNLNETLNKLTQLGFKTTARWRNGCSMTHTREGQTFNFLVGDGTYDFENDVINLTKGRLGWVGMGTGAVTMESPAEFLEACQQKLVKIDLEAMKKPTKSFYARVLKIGVATHGRLTWDTDTMEKVLMDAAFIKEYFERFFQQDNEDPYAFYNELVEMIRRGVFASKLATPILTIALLCLMPVERAYSAQRIAVSLQELTYTGNAMQELYVAMKALFEQHKLPSLTQKLTPLVMRSVPLKEVEDQIAIQLFAKPYAFLPMMSILRQVVRRVEQMPDAPNLDLKLG